MKPYIGITDFTSHEQIGPMLEVFRRNRTLGSNRVLHVGVMMSYNTLNGKDSRFARIFPANEAVADIFGNKAKTNDVYYCLHYADYRNQTLNDDLERAIAFGGRNLDAIQLDMTWPHDTMIARARRSRPVTEVILQVGKQAFDSFKNSPTSLVEKLYSYTYTIDRVLLDLSMGNGVPLDADTLLPFIEIISNKIPEIGIGIAGGLGPGQTHLIQSIIKRFPNISIDAESKLRPSGSLMDPINWSLAAQYLEEFLPVLD